MQNQIVCCVGFWGGGEGRGRTRVLHVVAVGPLATRPGERFSIGTICDGQ